MTWVEFCVTFCFVTSAAMWAGAVIKTIEQHRDADE